MARKAESMKLNYLGHMNTIQVKEMAKKGGVSSKTHTKQQLDNYANQHNPNNKAYIANKSNEVKQRSSKKKERIDTVADLEWFCYGWCDD